VIGFTVARDAFDNRQSRQLAGRNARQNMSLPRPSGFGDVRDRHDAAGKNHALTQPAKTTLFAGGNEATGLKKAPQATFFQ